MLLLVAAAANGQAQDRSVESEPPPSPAELRWRNTLILGGGSLAVWLYGKQNWWNEGFTGNFRSTSEGWFGHGTYAGGTDKLGHAWGTYLGTRALARALELAGNDEAASLRIATWSALGAYTAIEVLDGFSRKYRFSHEDAAANALGAGLAVFLERNPDWDRLLDFRLHYKPSPGSGFDPFGDYSGQTYLLVLKASGVPALRNHRFLRYLELAVGYGARGFEEKHSLRDERFRSAYIGISINLAQLLDDTAFREQARPSWTQRATRGFLEVIQPPGTGLYAGHRF